jgi:DUF438 domain-containing protein
MIARRILIIGFVLALAACATEPSKRGVISSKQMPMMFENLDTAIVVSDADFKVIYANEKCKQMFKALLGMENFVGNNMAECHLPVTMEKLKKIYQEFREKKKNLHYYLMDLPDGVLTIVSVPFYDGDNFAGVVEFIFEGSLG